MAQETILAYFDSPAQARAARDALIAGGVAASAVRVLPEEGTTYSRDAGATSYDHRRDEGGFWASLGNLFLPAEDRYAYAEGLSRGGAALSVTVDGAQYDHVADILERHGVDDLDAREAEWRQTGWTGYASDAGAAATTGAATATVATGAADMARTDMTSTDMARTDDAAIPVVEEQLRVGKRVVDRGRVRLRSYVVETPVQAQVELHSERVVVERHPVNRPVNPGDLNLQDRVIEARETAEVPVVAKEARVVEEVGLRTEAEEHTETVQDTVRKTEVEVVDERGEAERLRDSTLARDRR